MYETLSELFGRQTEVAKTSDKLYVRFPKGVQVSILSVFSAIKPDYTSPSNKAVIDLFSDDSIEVIYGFDPKKEMESNDLAIREAMDMLIEVSKSIKSQENTTVENLSWTPI